jgi:hypothetical protein
MMNKLMTVFFLCLAGFYSSFAQSAADFRKEFGEPTGQSSSFSISDKISMKPLFDKNGEVCWLQLSNPSSLKAALTFKDFKEVVERLIPQDKRGEKRQPFYAGQWATSKGGMEAILSYEQVVIVYGTTTETVGWNEPKRQIFDLSDFLSSLENKTGAANVSRKDNFIDYDSLNVAQVTIGWKNRKCQ